jgi:hypothetical protein
MSSYLIKLHLLLGIFDGQVFEFIFQAMGIGHFLYANIRQIF